MAYDRCNSIAELLCVSTWRCFLIRCYKTNVWTCLETRVEQKHAFHFYQIKKILTETVDAIISMYGVNNTQSTWSLLDSVQQFVRTDYTLYALSNEA